MSERVMASIEVVEEVLDIEGADRLQHYRVKGWWVVDQKGKYQVGNHVVFCEIDSFVPEAIAPFLTKGKAKTYNGVLGNVLKTIRLRGAKSQGLLLPVSLVEHIVVSETFVGLDVSFPLGIVKYERPESDGGVRQNIEQAGDWPNFIPKTDQERIQNVYGKLNRGGFWKVYEITEKLEGQSFTGFVFQGDVGVCSRNVRLKLDAENNWTNIFHKHNLDQYLPQVAEACGFDFAIQGEICGPGIQGNIYGLAEHTLFIYNIRNLTNHKDLNPLQRQQFCLNYFAGRIDHVPVLSCVREGLVQAGFNICTSAMEPLSRDELLAFANAPSKLASVRREGLVYKSFDNETFKVISDDYLEFGHVYE